MASLAAYRGKGCLTGGCAECGLCLAQEEKETKMVKNTHTVATDALATIGNIIDETAGRDAIHLAVEPVTAGFDLVPGQDIGIDDGIAKPRRPYLGIVDPFLTENVKKGERFWMLVYPRTITSLRHVWEHPGFDREHLPPVDETTDAKAASEKWLQDYAGEIDETFNTLMEAAKDWVDNGEWFFGATTDGYFGKYEGFSIKPDFWQHYQTYTGTIVPEESQQSFFTCAC